MRGAVAQANDFRNPALASFEAARRAKAERHVRAHALAVITDRERDSVERVERLRKHRAHEHQRLLCRYVATEEVYETLGLRRHAREPRAVQGPGSRSTKGGYDEAPLQLPRSSSLPQMGPGPWTMDPGPWTSMDPGSTREQSVARLPRGGGVVHGPGPRPTRALTSTQSLPRLDALGPCTSTLDAGRGTREWSSPKLPSIVPPMAPRSRVQGPGSFAGGTRPALTPPTTAIATVRALKTPAAGGVTRSRARALALDGVYLDVVDSLRGC